MSQYLLSVIHSGSYPQLGEAEQEEAFAVVGRFNDRLREAGRWVFAGGLAEPFTATMVDNTGGTPVITDGPHAETKEFMGGFWVITADDLDEALRWATDGSKACGQPVEVRAFHD